MIDRKQPLDVCKIVAKKQVDHKIEHDAMSKTKALKVVAEESGIPYNTLKQWFYPKSNDNRKIKRRKEKVVSSKEKKSGDTIVKCDTSITESDGDATLNLTSSQIKALKKILKKISIEELQDVVSKAVIISKEVGAGQTAAEIINLGLHEYSK